MSKLFLMAGAPGSGKSYWCKHHMTSKDKYISRDEIRFSMLEDGDDYFAKEGKVFDNFIKQINCSLMVYDNVFADATHLNFSSRNKTISRITAPVDEINVIFLDTPLELCLARNVKRTGRKFVPEDTIIDMYNRIRLPEFEEGIKKLYIVRPNQKIELRVLGLEDEN